MSGDRSVRESFHGQHRIAAAILVGIVAAAGVAVAQQQGGLPLVVTAHIEGIGDQTFAAGQFAGTRGQSRRLEGVAIAFAAPIPGLSIQYMGHVQDVGDTGWMADGQFLGSRGQSRRLEGIAIRLAGPQAGNFNVVYRCHIQDVGDSQWMSNGAFCGSRGQSRRLEGLEVSVVPR